MGIEPLYAATIPNGATHPILYHDLGIFDFAMISVLPLFLFGTRNMVVTVEDKLACMGIQDLYRDGYDYQG